MAERILIADDDSELCSLLHMMLKREGYEVNSVYNGQAALEHIDAQGVDLILLDDMMPVMNGFDMLRELYERPNRDKIRVILMTARSSMEFTDAAQELGVHDWLIKPFTPVELLEHVRAVLTAH
jgi:two-component system, OmpR family, copper resistance phosphate regulon response regulator CusR